jgi:hypothetical protein
VANIVAQEKPTSDSALANIPWLDADNKYALGIDGGKLVCRNPAGKKLTSVPKELKESVPGVDSTKATGANRGRSLS